MRLTSKSHPVLASFLAAGVALVPVLLMALSEIFAAPSGVVPLGEPDDADYRGAGLALAAMPFLYIIAIPVCYAVGALLLSFRLFIFAKFMGGDGEWGTAPSPAEGVPGGAAGTIRGGTAYLFGIKGFCPDGRRDGSCTGVSGGRHNNAKNREPPPP